MMDDQEIQTTTDEQTLEIGVAETVSSENEKQSEEKSTTGLTQSFDGYKNPDGSYDIDKLLKDFSAERDRAAGLRKKLAEPKKSKPFEISDLSISVPEEEKETLSDLIKTFNEAGISKDQTEKILSKLSEYAVDEKQVEKELETSYQEELKKLGSDKDTILNGLKTFADTMVANKVWDDQQRKAFADAIYTADAAKMFYNALQNINVIKAGTFASTTPMQNVSQEYSNQDKIDMYRRAFEMMKNNRSDGDAELKRLDKIFGIK